MIPALRLLIHLRIIVFEYLWHENNWNQLLNLQNLALPQVTEVHIDHIDSSETLSHCVMLFVKQWKNLKRIVLPVSSGCNDEMFDVAELDSTRKKLKNACELTILTDQKGNATNLNHELVKLKLVEFRYNGVCPFQRYHIVSAQ